MPLPRAQYLAGGLQAFNHRQPDGTVLVTVRAAGYDGEDYGSFRLQKEGKFWRAIADDNVTLFAAATQAFAQSQGALALRDRAVARAQRVAADGPVYLVALRGYPGYTRPKGTYTVLDYDWTRGDHGVTLLAFTNLIERDRVVGIMADKSRWDEHDRDRPTERLDSQNIYQAMAWLGLDAGDIRRTALGRALLENHVDVDARRAHVTAVMTDWARIEDAVIALTNGLYRVLDADTLHKAADLLEQVVADVVDDKA